MECKRVHWPNMVDVVNGLSMALERVFFVLGFLTGIEEFDCNTPFNGSRGKTYCKSTTLDQREEKVVRIYAPWPSVIHATALVMNFKLLSLSCAGPSIFRIS